MLCKWIVTWLGFKHCVYRHTHRRWVPRPDNKGWKEAEQENLVRLINPVSPIRTLIQTSPALALKRTGWTCEGSWKVSIKHTFQLNCLSLRRQKNQIIKQEAGWIEHSHVPYAAAQRSTQPGRQGTQSLHYINTVELTPPSHSLTVQLANAVQADSSFCLARERLFSATASHIHLSNDKFQLWESLTAFAQQHAVKRRAGDPCWTETVCESHASLM